MRCCSVALAAPSAACDTLVVLNATSPAQLALLVHVYMVRATVKGGFATSGLLPRRSTSAAPPFSTVGPSGRSEYAPVPETVHRPALDGEKSQYEPLSVVQ